MALSTKNAFTLIEAMLAIAILMIMGVGSIAANRLAAASVKINQLRSQANNLSVEAMEALESVRADSYLSLSPGTFHPYYDGTKWSLTAGQETINGFTRKITLTSVQRALVCFTAVCDITTQGGITDSGTLNAEVSVSWDQSGQTKEIKINSLITYWR